jgi:hypothetical protein
VLADGSRQDTEALREQIAGVLATLGLRLFEAKTRVAHLSEGFSFLGFRIQRRRKRGTAKWYVYTFIDDRPIRSVKAKIRALTRRTSQLDLGHVLSINGLDDSDARTLLLENVPGASPLQCASRSSPNVTAIHSPSSRSPAVYRLCSAARMRSSFHRGPTITRVTT